MKDFDPKNIKRVSISEVKPNDYNPKLKDTKEYRLVVDSIRINGLKSPIFVREVKGEKGYTIVDGEQRYTAALDLGYEEIYIYNLGGISETEAKSLTIWLEVQVPFDTIQLAPIAIELDKQDFALPYSKEELKSFEKLDKFDFSDFKPSSDIEVEEDDFTVLRVKMTHEEYDLVESEVKRLASLEGISEGRALELIVADTLSGYNPIAKNES